MPPPRLRVDRAERQIGHGPDMERKVPDMGAERKWFFARVMCDRLVSRRAGHECLLWRARAIRVGEQLVTGTNDKAVLCPTVRTEARRLHLYR